MTSTRVFNLQVVSIDLIDVVNISQVTIRTTFRTVRCHSLHFQRCRTPSFVIALRRSTHLLPRSIRLLNNLIK